MSDHLTVSRRYTSRPKAFVDLRCGKLGKKLWERHEATVAGTVRSLNQKLTDLQHTHIHNVVSSRDVHLDHNNCLEDSAVKGKTDAVKRISHARQTNPSAGAEL